MTRNIPRDHFDFDPPSIAESDRFAATYNGHLKADKEWLLSDRDVWYRNPYYKGPKGPHPEDY